MSRSWIFWFNGALVALGLAIALFPWTRQQPILAVLAGGLVGSGITHFFGSMKFFDTWTRLQSTLDNSWKRIETTLGKMSRGDLTSEEEALAPVRLPFHHYYVTRLDTKTREYAWRHQIIDFSKENVPGRLLADTWYPLGNDRFHLRLEAGIRDTRLIGIARHTKHQEPADVFVYPFMAAPGSVNAGIEVRQTLRANRHAITPGLLTTEPVNEWKKHGTVEDEETTRKLNELWSEGFLYANHDVVLGVDDRLELFPR